MLSLIRLLIIPHKKLFLLMLALLIWITAWFTFLSQSLQSITSYLDIQTIESLGGDMVIEGAKPLPAEKRAEIEALFTSDFQHSSTVSFLNSLSIGTEQPVLTTIIGYDETYPLYGTFETTRTEKNGVYISASLAELLTGEMITLGAATFPIAGEIVTMPTAGINIFDGGRFVFLPNAFIDRTELVQTGSRVSYREAYTFTTLPSEQLLDTIQTMISDQEVENITTERAQREEFFSQLKSVIVLALCSLIILTWSGLRIMNDMLVRRLLATLRLIRILGTTKKRLISAGVLVFISLLLLAYLLGGSLGYHAWKLLPWEMFSFTPTRDRLPYRHAIIVTTGVTGALLFNRQELFHKDNLLQTSLYHQQTKQQQLISRSIIALVLLFSLLVELGWTTRSLWLGLSIVCGMVILYWSVRGLLYLLAQATKSRKQSFRERWRTIRRSSQPGSPMPLMITLIASIVSICGISFLFWQSITTYITTFQQTDQANTFILNLRESDKTPLQTIFPDTTMFDVILGRIITIDTQPLSAVIDQEGLRSGSYTREFNMTTVMQDDTVVSGRPAGYILQAGEISVDSRVAESLGIRIGSQITMSIVGREFTFRVVQLRRTTRNAIKPFFFFQLPEAQFVDAPKSYFSVLFIDPEQRGNVLQSITENVGNHLSFIEVDALIAQIEELLNAVAWSILLVFSSVTFCGGVLLLLCFRHLASEHRHDIQLLSMLGVDKQFCQKTSRLVLIYPLIVALGLTILIIFITTICLRLFQDALPFTRQTMILTWGVIILLGLIGFFLLSAVYRKKISP